MWMIEHVLAIHGVSSSTPIVVYDEQSGIRAARAFWFLEYLGHPSVRVLDGGFGAWTRAALPVTRDAAAPPKSEWTGIRERSTLATWREVRDAIGKKDSVILDTRSEGEHCGHHRPRRARRRRPRRGPHRVDEQPHARRGVQARGRLEAMYESAGVTPDREVITYCQGGYRAAHSYLALRLLGYRVSKLRGIVEGMGRPHGAADSANL